MLAAILPDLDAPFLQRAANLLAYPAILKWNVLENLDAEKVRLARRIAEIEVDPRYLGRQLLLAPGVGKLVLALEEQEAFRAPHAQLLVKANHPLLDRLIETNYGTDAYDVPFWRLSYYTLWEAAGQILERFPEAKTFAETRAEVIQARNVIQSFNAKIAELKKEIAHVENLAKERDMLVVEFRTADATALESTRNRLFRYLEDDGFKDAAKALANDPALDGLAKRAAGLHAKLDYLEAMNSEQLEARDAALKEELAKMNRNIIKYERPKNRYSNVPADAIQKLRIRGEKDRKWFDTYNRSYQMVYVFDSYNRGSLAGEFLWWDVMTDGRLDGNFIPEVQEFHHSHPEYSYSGGSDALAAAAIASHDHEPGGSDWVDAS